MAKPQDTKSVKYGCVERLRRDDRMAIELFLGGVAGWDTGLRRRMDDGKSKQN